MEEVTLTIRAYCATPELWLQVSSLLKTMGHTLDLAIEQKHPDNDVTFKVENAHPEALTNTEPAAHPLRGIL